MTQPIVLPPLWIKWPHTAHATKSHRFPSVMVRLHTQHNLQNCNSSFLHPWHIVSHNLARGQPPRGQNRTAFHILLSRLHRLWKRPSYSYSSFMHRSNAQSPALQVSQHFPNCNGDNTCEEDVSVCCDVPGLFGSSVGITASATSTGGASSFGWSCVTWIFTELYYNGFDRLVHHDGDGLVE